MGMGRPGGGLDSIKSAEAGAIGEIEQRKSEVISQIESQRKQSISEVKQSIDSQIQGYKERRGSIQSSLSQLRKQLDQIPDVPDPRAQDARKRIKEQIKQLESALGQINMAINLAEKQKEAQAARISGQLEGRKKEVVSQLNNQKAQVLMKFAAQKMMMQNQLQMYQQRRGMEGGSKAKG